METIAENLTQLKSSIPKHVTLVAVSKTKSTAEILEAYQTGHRIFGENKVQEMTQKHEELPKDIRWHMIGHVQRNKVKYMAPFVDLVHGVDSLKLLKEINKQAAKNERVIRCLLQVHIAQEDTKFGLDANEIEELLASETFQQLHHIKVVGLMGMATFTENKTRITEEFATLKNLFDHLQQKEVTENFHPETLSMGMSGDYELAIAQGATMIRVGSAIFGERNYH